jgi:hypothetical protein
MSRTAAPDDQKLIPFLGGEIFPLLEYRVQFIES